MDDLTPLIEFRVTGFAPNENAYKFVMQVIRPGMLQMQLTNKDVRKIIIADNAHYGTAIKEISPEDGYTNDGIYQGVGKNLPRFENGHYAGSSLVVHQCIIESFVSKDDARPAGESDAMQYALYHELGHCVDYRHRPEFQYGWKPVKGGTSVISANARRNSATLISEYAACFHSASFLTQSGFRFNVESTGNNMQQYFTALIEKRNRYRNGLLALHVLRDAAIETFWRFLIEYAKWLLMRAATIC